VVKVAHKKRGRKKKRWDKASRARENGEAMAMEGPSDGGGYFKRWPILRGRHYSVKGLFELFQQGRCTVRRMWEEEKKRRPKNQNTMRKGGEEPECQGAQLVVGLQDFVECPNRVYKSKKLACYQQREEVRMAEGGVAFHGQEGEGN